MITVEVYSSFFEDATVKDFRRDGVLIGEAIGEEITRYPTTTIPYELSRAQGYKYWKKHFKNRLIWDLPEALQEAINKEPTAYGEYTNREGEVIGYIG